MSLDAPYTSEFERHFDSFIHRLDWAVELGIDELNSMTDKSAMVLLKESLDIPFQNLDKAGRALLKTWAVVQTPLLGPGDEIDFYEALRGYTDDGVIDAVDTVAEGQFGAWRIGSVKGQYRGILTDGQSVSRKASADVLTDWDWFDLPHPETYAGWHVEFDFGSAFILATELTMVARDKIEDAAKRSAWGDGDDFRQQDYAEDVLALTLCPECFDTYRDEERIFLNPETLQWRDKLIDGIRQNLPDVLCENGFQSLLAACVPTEWDIAYIDEYPWSIAAAQALDDTVDELISDLASARTLAAYRSILSYRIATPPGPNSLQYLMPIEELLQELHLQPDGTIDHRRTASWAEYPLAATDLDSSQINTHPLRPELSIHQVLAIGTDELDDAVVSQLRQAAQKFHVCWRWTTIVALDEQSDSWLTEPIDIDALCRGLQWLFPGEVLQTPLRDFQEPARGFFSRIENALTQVGRVGDDQAVTLRDLPATGDNLRALPGIGDGSVRHLGNLLRDFISQWPESAGHRPVASPDRRSHESIDAGLNELDDLFK